jgi:hypothetical protein
MRPPASDSPANEKKTSAMIAACSLAVVAFTIEPRFERRRSESLPDSWFKLAKFWNLK